MAKSTGPDPVQRTSLGLRNALFDEIDSLRRGETDSKRAHAVARIAAEIVNTVKMEMEVARSRQITETQEKPKRIPPVDLSASDGLPEAAE